jgi:hypothetical protein
MFAFVLHITRPDGTRTTTPELLYGPQVVVAVASAVKETVPGTTEREAVKVGMAVARATKGITYHHVATGLRFRVELADTAGLRLLGSVPAQRWRSTTYRSTEHINAGTAWALARGWMVWRWDDTNLAGERVTLTRIMTDLGQTVALYETTED